MQQLAQDIKNETYRPCYLLYGSEDYLRRQYRDRLKKALVPEDDTMNYNYYCGKEINVNEVIDQAETMPFFADRRVIMLENTGLLKAGGEKLAEYVNEQAPSTVLIFVEESVDKRSKLFKALSSCGRVTEFSEQSPDTLAKWILGKVKKEEKQIDKSAMELLVNRTGTDMATIDIELEKLFSYTYGRNAITVRDVEEIVTVSTGSKVFDMTKAIANKQQKLALDMYHDLLFHKESPFGILALIAKQFNTMLTVKELDASGYSVAQISKKLNLWDKFVREYKSQADRFTHKRLREAIESCVKADEDVKYGNMSPEMSVELLIIEYSSK